MPYEKVSLLIAMVFSFIMSILLAGNYGRDAEVAVIDLDNSAYTRSLIERIDSSPYMRVTAVLNTPTDPATLMYKDEAYAVVYLPQGLEKDRYTGTATNIGVFYDNTSSASTSGIKSALNEIVGMDNAAASGDTGSTNDSIMGSLSLADRELFNPQGSTSNATTLGFLFFFGSMFFVFATIGMVPRLRLMHKLDDILLEKTPLSLLVRLVPYAGCLIVSWAFGLAVLRIWGDLNFSGSLLLFLVVQVFFAFTLGAISLTFGWTAANPGIASSRMILFIPGGFILGGPTNPVSYLSDWVVTFSHVFPLTWEFHFTRDIISRGAGPLDLATELGAFMLYMAAVLIVFSLRFYSAQKALIKARAAKGEREEKRRLFIAELGKE